MLQRQSYRTGMILNSEEIVSLVHPPTPAVQSEKLLRDALKTKPAPALSLNQSLILGKNEHQGAIREVSISPEQRTRHVYLIGASGSGKSTLLLNLIRQDMENGEGLCLLDPHGDLIDDVITRVPDSRLTDVILFDPADSEYPIGFNVLQANSETEKTLIASDLVATFRRFSNSWGDVMDAVLANAVLAILENKKGGTLFDLKRLLVEKDFRQEYLKTVEDDGVRYFWQYEYPALAGRSQSSVLVRLDTFLRQKLIRNIVCQNENRLNFRQMMDEKKILLIKLSGGLIGSENAALLGTLLVSKLQQIALSRQDTESGKRPYFWLYLDEFHHFVTPSMESLLSGVRKYRIGLHLAHQEFRQLQSRDLEVAQSVLSNCATRICFRLGDTDAERFAAGFSFFDKEHLQNLGTGEAVARIEHAEYDFNLKTSPALKVSPDAAGRKREEILRLTREQFAGRRVDVEAAMQALRPPLIQTVSQSKEKVESKAAESNISAEKENQTKSKTERSVETKLPSNVVAENLQRQTAEKNPTQHRYLQELVKRIGEKHGFLAIVEKEVFGGIGKIDVALEKGDQKIACEISVTTPPDYELDNIQKCLASSYGTVVVISPDKKHLASIRQKATENLSGVDLAKVVFMPPETFTGWLKEFDSTTRDKQDDNKRDKVNGTRSERRLTLIRKTHKKRECRQ
ncbi:MAG TPA: type IV secretion system DNA-binding domain-containing protein [Pyrinomonadaceae bacterium]